MAGPIEPASGGVVIDLRIVPRAGRSGLAGLRDGSILIRLGAAPVDGAANHELVALLAAALDVPKRAIRIVSGERARRKRVTVEGIDERYAASRLLPGEH